MSGITDPTEQYFKDGLWAWVTSAWVKLVATAGGFLGVAGRQSDGTPAGILVDSDGTVHMTGSLTSFPHALLDGSVHSDTVAGAAVKGDVIIGIDQGGGVIKWQRLVAGTVGQVLTVQANGSLAYADGWGTDAMSTEQRIFCSKLGTVLAGELLISNRASFVYVGKTRFALTPKFVNFYVTVIGAGAQVAEVGLFSTPAAPCRATQTVTKIEATGTLTSLITLGVKKNTVAFSTLVPAGTHLWAGIRTAMATTQPTVSGLVDDFLEGNILNTAAAGALTGDGPWAGAIIAASHVAEAANLHVTLD